MGNIFGGGNADEEEEEDDERLRRWRPAIASHQHGALKRNKATSKSSESSDEGSGGHSDGQSVASSASKIDSESDKSDSQGDEKSDGSEGSGKDGSSSEEGSENDEELQELARRDLDKKKKKIVVRMDFPPLLSLHEPLSVEMEVPADLFAHAKKKRKAVTAEKKAIEDATSMSRKKAKAAAEWLNDMGLEEVPLVELAQGIGEDIDELRYALVQSKRFTVDEEGIVRKALLQRILDIMESDIETLQEVLDKLEDADAAGVKAAVKNSGGELRMKVANDIELVEHVDVDAEQRIRREEEREKRAAEKEEKRRAKAKRSKKGEQVEEDSDSESSTDEEGAGNVNRVAEKKALAFRRVQVQRKIEEFLKLYTKGQNLTKISAKGKRYHRRVYVDTTRKSLVVQGASGPKFFPFAAMKEVDIETRTTKEGRVETLVICAIEKRGRIVKELNLAFPDQARANTFVNCVTLFSLALRSK